MSASKPRIHKLAYQLGLESKAVLAKLKEMGVAVKSPSSTVELPTARPLRGAFVDHSKQTSVQPTPNPAVTRRAATRLSRPPAAAKQGSGEGGWVEEGQVTTLLALWDELSALTPNPARSVAYLSQRAGIPRSDVERFRAVRNACAHPAHQGWPSPYEMRMALATARELRDRLQVQPTPP